MEPPLVFEAYPRLDHKYSTSSPKADMNIRKAKSSEHHSHIKKFLDNGKDPLRRLKSLRSGLEKATVVSCKEIVTDNASAVFHVFYASFTSLEQTIQDRVQKGRNTNDQVKELLDVILPSLEKIIVFVPEKIHKRWQYNSTCLVIRKLLHPDNIIELRQFGIKLLVLWLQALQENAGDAAIELFASAIPRFPPSMTPDGLPGSTSLTSSSSNATSLCERYGVYSSNLTDSDAQLPELPPSTTAFPADYSTIPGKQEWVSTSVLYPLCAASPSSTDPTMQLMEHLLSCLTSQVGRLKWNDTANHMKGFSFLFYQFKLFYLACLYQNFRSDAGLYAPIPPPEIKNPLVDDGSLQLSEIASDSVLLSPRAGEEDREDSLRDRTNSSVSSKRPTHSITVSTVIKLQYDTSDPIYNAIRQLILKYVIRWIMPGYHSNRPGSIQPKQATPSPSVLSPMEEAFIPKGSDLMRDTWFTSRDNVNLLFEIFHKGFQLSLSHPGIVNRLTELYVSWVMDNEKPLFMQPPMSESMSETSLVPPSGGQMLVSPASSLSVVPWEIISGYSKFDRSSICAGVQPSLRMFVAHSSQLFLHKAKDSTTLDNQVESCNRIIKLYQDIAQQWLLDKEGWEYLLAVLLYLVQQLLREDPPANRDTTLGGCLADNLLHTLFVCFVKASMVAELSSNMWDRLVTVVSSLTKWREVVTQWKVVMRSMTQCLARVVYHLDLDNPPLQQIEETHHFRKRSVTQPKTKPLDLYRKPSFGDFRPRGPSRTAPRTKPTNKRTSSSPKMIKAVTVEGESPSNSIHSTPNSYHRRTSTPATIPNRPASPYSSETMPPLYHRVLSREKRVIEEEGVELKSERDTGARGDSAAHSLSETSHIVIAEESEVTRSPRSRRGYSKLKVRSEPASEAVIANSHAVEGNLEPLSPNRVPDSSKELLSSKERGDGEFKLVNLTSSPKVIRRDGGGLVISNEATDEIEQTRKPGEDQPDSPVVVASDMTDEQLSPLRRSRSEDASLFRQIKPTEDEDPLARSISQQPNNRPSFTIAQSFSEFVPDAKTTGVQFSPLHPHESERPPLLKDPGKQPSTVYEESTEVEESGSEVPVSYFSPVHNSPSREGSWTPVTAAVVWQRMLRMLGDVNKISQPSIHALAMSYVRDIWKMLEEVESNLGISIDNMGPASCPDHMPPMMLLIPWVVKACSLSAEYSEGRKVAYQLLCEMVLRHSSSSPSLSLLPHFYHLLHLGLQPATCPEDELNVVVKASCQLFSFGLPGSTVLLHDCLSVCTHILGTRSTSVPRIEALTLLGSMQYLLVQYKDTPLPIPGSGGKTRLGSVLRDNLTRTLFAAACKEPLRQSRCLALHQVGMLAYTELRSQHPSKSVTESMNILLASLRFSDIPVAMVAMDMLTLLVEVAGPMEQHFPSSPAVVLGALSSSLASSLLQKEDKILKVIISLMYCLRDWVMALPVQRLVSEGTVPQPVFTAIFEVLHYAANLDDSRSSSVPHASSFPVDVKLQPLEPTKTRTSSNVSSSSSSSPGSVRQQQQAGLQPSVSKQGEEWVEQIKTAARAVLSHLINQLGHFPFSCGAAQMSSVVSEYHDCPSLRFLNELSTEIFYLPRVQFFALNHSAIITLIEIPTSTKVDGVSVATFETRVIVRDVIGKHSWDSAILYGPDSTPRHQSSIGDRSPVLVSAPSSESLHSAATDSEHSTDQTGAGMTRNPHDPPTWRSHTSDDILNDLLGHLESTSPECLPHPGVVGMTAPAPAINHFTDITEGRLLAAVEQQRRAEIQYHSDTYSLPCMEAIPVKAPEHVPSMFAFHHCRVFLSHLGLLSWNRRNYLDVLEKNEQLIRELKHLDGTLMQCRQTYKVAVLYVAHGQEDRYSVLCNSKGSKGFEEFVAGLGWEVDMETHAGYMGGLNRTFCKGCTLPYYATSSEEILFHVSTRMPSKGKDIEQVRHLGNDEIHIVWSEHWRDYRRTVFKTHFADVLIIIYPLPNNLFRVQINRKDMRMNVSFGPLFDGAVVDKACLPSLVRATAINASRALRTPLVGYRGRYPERFNIIQDVMKMKVKCSYEDFAQSVIHPIEFDPGSSSAPPTVRHSPVKQLAPATSIYSIKHGSSPETRWSMSPKVTSLLRLTRSGSKGHSERRSKKYLDTEEITRRPRSKTVEEAMSPSQLQSSHVSRSQRHVSVPDNLPSLGISVERAPTSPTLSIITSPVDAGSRSHSLSTVTSPLTVTTGFHLPSEQR